MMTPKIKEQCRPTYHRDGSVSYWDVYLQQWARRPAQEVTEAVQASHDDVFRRRVANMSAQYHRTCAERARPLPGVDVIDGALAFYGADHVTGNEYQLVFRYGGAANCEVWHNRPDQENWIWRALPTPVGMIDHVVETILARREVAQ